MAKQLSSSRKLLFSLITLVVTLAVFELAASLYLRIAEGYDGEHLQWHSYDPYKNIVPTPGFIDTRGVSHNSMGFRGSQEYDVEKPRDTFRVVLMGGSTAYGLGTMWPYLEKNFPVLADGDTPGVMLEEELRKYVPNGKRLEVINAAISSHWTHHHIIHLNQHILNYNPDLIVFLDGYNDYFFFYENHDQFASYKHTRHAETIMGEPTIKAVVYANLWWLYRKSALIHIVGRAARKMGYFLHDSGPRLPLELKEVQPTHRRIFDTNALKMNQRIAAMLQAEGVKGVFVLQPMLILERNRKGMTKHELDLLEFNVISYRENYEQFMHEAVKYVRERMQETVVPMGADFIDATSVFAGIDGQVYTDYCHLTPLGNRVLVELVAGQIGPWIRASLSSAIHMPASAVQ